MKKQQALNHATNLAHEVQRLDALLRGTRLILAGIVHQVGGEVVLDEPILRMMESGDFTMEQSSQDDPISIRLVVTKKEPKVMPERRVSPRRRDVGRRAGHSEAGFSRRNGPVDRRLYGSDRRST